MGASDSPAAPSTIENPAMSVLSPLGTAKEQFLRMGAGHSGDEAPQRVDGDDFEPMYLGWEIARCAHGLTPQEGRAVAAIAAACMVAVRQGSTRMPLDETRLVAALAHLGAVDTVPVLKSLLTRTKAADKTDPVTAIVGRVGERKPLIVDGEWLYIERMHTLEDRFCAQIRRRIARAVIARDARSVGRALSAVALGPPPLTDEQKRAVREALSAPLTLISGGPGSGKTTIVVAVVRALAWLGESMAGLAIAAPTGKAAQRLREAIVSGLAPRSDDIGEAGLGAIAPMPQTLHHLLGWSPSSGRFARHENDPLPHRVIVVDEASMVDLALMDQLMRALAEGARLVLLGDANQLPSVEAGAVFRDLCIALRPLRLSNNLRVGQSPGGPRIVAAARSVNRGALDTQFTEAVATRDSVAEVSFEGVEHLAAPWAEVGEELLDRWWRERISSLDDFARRITRTYRTRAGLVESQEAAELRVLVGHQARARLLCATRSGSLATGAEAINERLLARFRFSSPRERSRYGSTDLVAGAPVMVERNDYERRLFNGDQGIVVHGSSEESDDPSPIAVFAQGDGFQAFPVGALTHIGPCLAMTVHKAQGSEFDDVVLILPETDLPLLTRELVYTAMTRARRSVLIVGERNLLARAVSRTMERHSGVAEKIIVSAD
jgi:exodeoxyribonuclease V alpha subunit